MRDVILLTSVWRRHLRQRPSLCKNKFSKNRPLSPLKNCSEPLRILIIVKKTPPKRYMDPFGPKWTPDLCLSLGISFPHFMKI